MTQRAYNSELLAKSAKILMILKPVSQLLGVTLIILLARVITPEQFGIYNVILSALVVFGGVASFGIANVLQRFLPEYIKDNQNKLAKNLFVNCSKLRAISIILFFCVGLFFSDELFSYLELEYSNELFVLLLFFALTYFQTRLFPIFFYSYLDSKTALLGQVFLVLIKALGYILCFFYKVGLKYVLIVDTVASVICIGFYLVVFKIKYKNEAEHKEGKPIERNRLVRYGMFYNFNDFGGAFLGKDLSNLVIMKLLDAKSVAINALSQRLSDMILKFSPVKYFSDILRPAFFSLDPDSDQERISTIFSLLTKAIYIIEIPVCIFVCLTANELLYIVGGKEYQGLGYIFSAVICITIINSIALPIGYVAQLLEKSDIIFYSKIFAFLTLPLSYVLGLEFGLVGIVVAVGICTLLKNLFIAWFVRGLINLGEVVIFIVALAGKWCLFLLFTLFVFNSADLNAFIKLALVLCMTIAVFLAINYTTSLTYTEKNELRELLPAKLLNSLKLAKLRI